MRQILKVLPSLMMALFTTSVSAAEKTCNLWQVCASNDGQLPSDRWSNVACGDPSLVSIPIFVEGGYAPAKIRNSVGKDAMADACPYIDISEALCCNQDNA